MKFKNISKLAVILFSAFIIFNCGGNKNIAEIGSKHPITEEQYLAFLKKAQEINAKLTKEMKADVAVIDKALTAAENSKNEAEIKTQRKAKADRIKRYYADKKEALKVEAAKPEHGGFTGENYAKDAQFAIHALLIKIKKEKDEKQQIDFAQRMCEAQGKEWKDNNCNVKKK